MWPLATCPILPPPVCVCAAYGCSTVVLKCFTCPPPPTSLTKLCNSRPLSGSIPQTRHRPRVLAVRTTLIIDHTAVSTRCGEPRDPHCPPRIEFPPKSSPFRGVFFARFDIVGGGSVALRRYKLAQTIGTHASVLSVPKGPAAACSPRPCSDVFVISPCYRRRSCRSQSCAILGRCPARSRRHGTGPACLRASTLDTRNELAVRSTQ